MAEAAAVIGAGASLYGAYTNAQASASAASAQKALEQQQADQLKTEQQQQTAAAATAAGTGNTFGYTTPPGVLEAASAGMGFSSGTAPGGGGASTGFGRAQLTG